jgi:hypothetical protein
VIANRFVNEENSEKSVDRVLYLSNSFKSQAWAGRFMSFPGPITAARALIFTYLSNPTKFDGEAFVKACTKFGMDCPVA